jgi:DNA-binding CsgD family transcriptional regulator
MLNGRESAKRTRVGFSTRRPVMGITRRDFEDVLNFLHDLYDRRALHDFADRTITALARMVAAERIVYGDFDVVRQAARFAMQPPVVTDHNGTVDGAANGALQNLERDFGNHPLFRYYLQTNDGRAHKASQVMTRSQFQRYAESETFARHFGMRYQMGIFFPAGPTLVTTILVMRGERDFTERERGLLNRLHPHLVRAFRNTASFNRMSRDVDTLFELLEGPTSSVVVLSETGGVKRWTEQAKTWIAKYCRTPFPAGGDCLPDCFAEWYNRQLALVAQQTLAPQSRDPLVVDKNGRQLTVQLIPDHFHDEHLLLLNEKRGDTSWTALGEHGLTPRESEVLAWVAKGKTNADIGTILGLSDRTVQKHLEHIYQKLGVETRTTATVRALKMLGIEPT